MVRCASLFRQLMGLFYRRQFHKLVVKYRTERYAKGFTSLDHFGGTPQSERSVSACCVGYPAALLR